MRAFFSFLLIALVLLQTFGREVLVADFTLRRAAITARFCVNKARPQLHCDGQLCSCGAGRLPACATAST